MGELVHFLQNACLPAKIYLALIIVNFFSMFLMKQEKKDLTIMITAFIFMLLIGLGITWFGNYLCSNGFEVITWLIVLLPVLTLVRNLRKVMK